MKTGGKITVMSRDIAVVGGGKEAPRVWEEVWYVL